jgi:hypothetical protein
LLSPPKKGPRVVAENAEPPDTTPSNLLLFSLGTMETKLARALFKAARKGKSKIGSAVHEPKVTYEERGAMSSLPSSNENLVLELHGAVQAYCSLNLRRLIRAQSPDVLFLSETKTSPSKSLLL